MKRHLFRPMAVACIIMAVLAATGCAPSAKIPVLRPAEVNLKGSNKIAIGTARGRGGREVADLLTSKLFATGKFEVLDRDNLNRLMEEHKLNLSGVVDQDTAVELGKFIGAAVLATVNVSTYNFTRSDSYGEVWKDKEGKSHRTYYKKGKATVTATFKITSLTSGKILAVKTITKEKSDKNSATDVWPESPDRTRLLGIATNATVDRFIKMIAPYTEYVTIKFAKNDKKVPEMEQGVNFAKAGLWDKALERFQTAVKNHPSHAGAWWNLGLAYEYTNQFTEAIDAFSKANTIKSCPKCLQEINNVKRRESERKKLADQGAL